MPLTQTVNGLLVNEEFDSLNGWTFVSLFGTLTFDTSTKKSGSASARVDVPGADTGLYKTLNLGSGSSRSLRFWCKLNAAEGDVRKLYLAIIGGGNLLGPDQKIPNTANGDNTTHDWTLHTATVNSTLIGNQLVYNYFVGQSGSPGDSAWIDRLIVAQTSILTVTGLVPSQKVELYRTSDNALLDTQTVAAGQSQVQFNIDAQEYPFLLYCKIYGTDGSTLIETTTSYQMCGGDTWNWTSTVGTISVSADQIIIYRNPATGTPKIANVTANLKTPAGANYPGATVHFYTTTGTMTPVTDTTDSNGNAHSQLASLTHGMAVIMAQFLGDGTVPGCSAYCTVHVFYDVEAPDSSKGFQVYIEGYPLAFVSGSYAWNEQGAAEQFQVEIAEWDSNIIPNGLVSIYRKGVKEFAGLFRIIGKSLGEILKRTLSGPDVSGFLSTRVVDTKIYSSKTPQYIINDLLTSFPCGITPGILGSYPSSIDITIETEWLFDAIKRITDQVGWKFRVNSDRTLDFAPNFTGGTTTVKFEEGVDIIDRPDYTTDYSAVANYIRMRGNAIVSTKQDGTKIQQQGLLQAPSFQKNIADQSTLDQACQALLDLDKEALETIKIEVKDTYTSGTYGTEDQVQIESPTLGLTGYYTVKRIERDLLDPNLAKLDISNRGLEYEKMDEAYRRMIKDASL